MKKWDRKEPGLEGREKGREGEGEREARGGRSVLQGSELVCRSDRTEAHGGFNVVHKAARRNQPLQLLPRHHTPASPSLPPFLLQLLNLI